MIYEVKPLPYKKMDGMSEKMLADHHDVLYAGYVNKLNEINDRIANLEPKTGNATYSPYRELKIESSFAENAVHLHEWYFENIGGNGTPSEAMLEMLDTSFMSFQAFQEELMAAGLSARGWVVMSLDGDGQLRLHLCDAHNMNGIWGAFPVLVLDVYEHAYFTDYGTDRKSYIDAFIRNINWDVVESRLLLLK